MPSLVIPLFLFFRILSILFNHQAILHYYFPHHCVAIQTSSFPLKWSPMAPNTAIVPLLSPSSCVACYPSPAAIWMFWAPFYSGLIWRRSCGRPKRKIAESSSKRQRVTFRRGSWSLRPRHRSPSTRPGWGASRWKLEEWSYEEEGVRCEGVWSE